MKKLTLIAFIAMFAFPFVGSGENYVLPVPPVDHRDDDHRDDDRDRDYLHQLDDDEFRNYYESHLGMDYLEEDIVNTHFKSLLTRAMEGSSEDQHKLGVVYYNMPDFEGNYERALYWFRKAANQGHAEAQYETAKMYQDLGTDFSDEDLNTAFDWYIAAASQGHAKAQYSLSFMYEFGHGAPKDKVKSFYWLEKAASQGHKNALIQITF